MKTTNKIWIYLIAILGVLLMITNSCKKKEDNSITNPNPLPVAVIDIDGNEYHSVYIDGQIWLVENLKVTHYRNGDPIPNVTNGYEWGNLTTGAYCDYKIDANNSTTYGRLYNWYAVNDSRNIAPTGWRVPNDGSWTYLTDDLGGENVAGGKLKEAGTTHWVSPNTGATNEKGFTALPGGFRVYNGNFSSIGYTGYWWSSTDNYSNLAYLRIMYNNVSNVVWKGDDKKNGFSVRCIKD
jgi:uncharacterized protein (TIGR02145 family)